MVGQVGYSTIGGSIQSPFSQGVSCRFVPNIKTWLNTGRVSKGVVWIDGTGTGTATFAIYSDNGGNPDTLLGYSKPIQISATARWYNFCDLTEVGTGGLTLADGHAVHLAVSVDNPGLYNLFGDNNALSYIGGTSNQFTELNQGGATFPAWATSVTALSQSDLNLSIYVEYYTPEIVLGYPSIGELDTGTYVAPAQLGSYFVAEKTKFFDTVYVRMRATTTSGRMSVALYEDLANTPKYLVAQSGGSYVTFSTVEKWYACPMKAMVKSGGKYWIVVSCNQNFIMKYDLTGGGTYTFDDYTTYNVFGDPYNTGPDTYYPARMSFYLQNSTYFAEAPQFTTFNGSGFFGKLLTNLSVTNNLNTPRLVSIGDTGTDFVANSTAPYQIPGLTGSTVYLVTSDGTSRYSGPINLILPPTTKKDVVGIKTSCSFGNTVVISPYSGSGAAIDGHSNWSLSGDSSKRYQEITLVSDGASNWFII